MRDTEAELLGDRVTCTVRVSLMGADCVIDSRCDRVCVRDERGDRLVDGLPETPDDLLELDVIDDEAPEETDGLGLRETPGDRDDVLVFDISSERLPMNESVALLEDVDDARDVTVLATSCDDVAAEEKDVVGAIVAGAVSVGDVVDDGDAFCVDRPDGMEVEEAEIELDSVQYKDSVCETEAVNTATVDEGVNVTFAVLDGVTRDDGEMIDEAETQDDTDADDVED